MSAWFILENLLNGIVDVNDVNIFLLEGCPPKLNFG